SSWGRDKRNISRSTRRNLDAGEALSGSAALGLWDCRLWHVCKLGRHHSRGSFRQRRSITHHGSRPLSPTVAESLITLGFVSASLAIIAAAILVLWGLTKKVAS